MPCNSLPYYAVNSRWITISYGGRNYFTFTLCFFYLTNAMKSLLVTLCILVIHLTAFSQNSEQPSKPVAQQKLDLLKDTYELKSDSRLMPMLPSNLADIIEKNRKENETNVIQLQEHLELIIYPRNQIKKTTAANKQ